MQYRWVKWSMAAVAAVYLAAVFLIPGMWELRRDFVAWLLYGVYLLVTAMVWGMGGKANRRIGEGENPEELKRKYKILQEQLRCRNYWGWP